MPQIRSKTIKVKEKDDSGCSEPSTPRSNSSGSKLGNVWSRLTGSSKEQRTPGKILPYVNEDDKSGTNIACQSIMLGELQIFDIMEHIKVPIVFKNCFDFRIL